MADKYICVTEHPCRDVHRVHFFDDALTQRKPCRSPYRMTSGVPDPVGSLLVINIQVVPMEQLVVRHCEACNHGTA